MEQLGINSNVCAGGKVFHVQTAGNRAGLSFTSEIFDSGKVITVHHKKLDENQFKHVDEGQFREFLNVFHQDIAWEIELLFFIRDRVKTIKHAISNNKMGLLFLRKGLIEEAIGEFAQAIAINPQFVESYCNLGLAYLQKADPTKAIEVFHKAIDLEPQFPDVYNHLGVALTKTGDFDHAIEAYEKALHINPRYLEAQLNLDIAILLANQANYKSQKFAPSSIHCIRVVADLQRMMVANPETANYRFFAARFEKAIKHISSGELSKAVDLLVQIRETSGKPNLDDAIHGFYLKFLFGGAGKDERILNDYRAKLERGVMDNPNYADLQNSLGVVYLIQCRNLFIKAMTAFKKAYEINPTYKHAHRNFKLVQNDGREFLNLLRAILK